METRTIIQNKIFVLYLNPMRGNTEERVALAVSFEKDKLITYYNSEKSPEPYTDKGTPSFECHGDTHNWQKVFKKYGPLEWFNPVDNENDFMLNMYKQGIDEVWVNSDCIMEAVSGIHFIQ